jgi:hypothetical protein
MAGLASVSPGSSYPGLIKTIDNVGITGPTGPTGNYSNITDGNGSVTNLSITGNSTKVNFNKASGSLGKVTSGGRFLQQIAVKNRIVYATGDDTRLDITDFTDPANPVKLSNIPVSASRRVFIEGNYLYVSTGIWDISDPSNPLSVSSYPFKNNLIVRGGILVGGGEGPISITDVRNVKSPVLVYTGASDSRRNFEPVSFDDSGRYVIGAIIDSVGFYNNRLGVLDISDIKNPYYVAEIPIEGTGFYNCYYQGYFYATSSTTCVIINVKDPKNPFTVKRITLPFGSGGQGGMLRAYGDTLYMTGQDTQQIHMYDITDRLDPIYISSIRTSAGRPRSFEVEGNYLYNTTRDSPFYTECFYLGGLYANTLESGNALITKLSVGTNLNVFGETTVQTLSVENIQTYNNSVTVGNSSTLGQIVAGAKDADPLAIIEANSSSQGLLLPRVTSAGLNTIKKISTTDGGTGASGGSGYTSNTYVGVPLTGGNGSLATANLTITKGNVTSLTITNGGKGYEVGNLLTVENKYISSDTSIRSLTGLTGGAGYTDGTYIGVGLTAAVGFTGYNSSANVVVNSGSVTSVTVTSGGIGYQPGQSLTVLPGTFGTGGSGFLISVGSIGLTGSGIQLRVTGTSVTEGLLAYNTQTSSVNLYTGITGGWNSFGTQTIIKGATSAADSFHLTTYNSIGATGIAIANDLKVTMAGPLRITGMPTSSAGLASGTLWSDPTDSYRVKMVP